MRKLMITSLVLAVALTSVAVQAKADDDFSSQVRDEIKGYFKDEGLMKVKWKNGLNFETADKKTKLKWGGRVMVDAWFIDDDDMIGVGGYNGTQVESGVEFRRVRLYSSGQIAGITEYKVQMDFAQPNNPVFKDAYFGLKNLDECWGCAFPDLRVGHFKAPFGLEELTSSKYITFMERSAPTNAFAPSRKIGFMVHDSLRGGQLNYGLGWYSLDQDQDDDGEMFFDNGWAVAGRLAWTPWNDCSCPCRFLHVGVGAIYATDIEQQGNGRPRFRARPYTHHTGTRLVSTPRLDGVDDYTIFNFELAFVYGPWSLQGEYFMCNVTSNVHNDPSFSGYYVQGSYWLTGECRPYKKGTFSRVKPCANFLDKDCCGTGGFELAVRYSFLDLNDQAIFGGEQTTITAGVNWHLNPNARIMLNWFTVDVDGGPVLGVGNSESLMGLGMRWQIDF